MSNKHVDKSDRDTTPEIAARRREALLDDRFRAVCRAGGPVAMAYEHEKRIVLASRKVFR